MWNGIFKIGVAVNTLTVSGHFQGRIFQGTFNFEVFLKAVSKETLLDRFKFMQELKNDLVTLDILENMKYSISDSYHNNIMYSEKFARD